MDLKLILFSKNILKPKHNQGVTGEESKSDIARSRHNSYDLPKSFEPTNPLPLEFIQIEQVQKLKEHVGSLVQAKVIFVDASSL